MNRSEKIRVFISYSHADGSLLANQVIAKLTEEKISTWRDIDKMSGVADNWQEVKQAIDNVEHLVLILTPQALESKWVKKECSYARQEGVQVSLIHGNDIDRARLPFWQQRRQLYNFEETDSIKRLIELLHGDGKVLKVPYDSGEIHESYVPRPRLFRNIKNELLNKQGDCIATTVALRGAGGSGKTVIADALCRDEDLRCAFSDGIIRIVVSKNPENLVALLISVIEKITGKRPGFTDINLVTEAFANLIDDLYVLLVIDDVWSEQHLRQFLPKNHKNSARLITTRNDIVLPFSAKPFIIDKLSSDVNSDESFQLISYGLSLTPNDRIIEQELKALAKRLGFWAQMLAMANRKILRLVRKKYSINDSVQMFRTRLDNNGLSAIDSGNKSQRDRAIGLCIEASLEDLEQNKLYRFLELAIFPEDQEIPLEIIQILWKETGGYDADESEDYCQELDDLSLLQSFSGEEKTIKLHDNILFYLREKIGLPKIYDTNKKLIIALSEKFDKKWSEIHSEHKYVWKYLIRHFRQAGMTDEADNLLVDYKWIKNKLHVTDEIALYTEYLPESTNPLVRKVGQALALSLKYISENKNNLSSQLWGRLGYFKEEFDEFLSDVYADNRCEKLFLLYPSFTPPGLEKIRLIHHQHKVGFAKFCLGLHESKVFTASHDAKIMIWSSNTGAFINDIEAHDDEITSLSFSMDYSLCVTASSDFTAKLWNAFTREHLYTFNRHSNKINSAIFSVDGTKILTASNDGIAIIWDTTSGKLIKELKTHQLPVNSAVFSFDSRKIITASNDCTVCIWDEEFNWCLISTFEHDAPVNSAIFSSECDKVITALNNGNVYIWSLQGRSAPFIIYAHNSCINCLALSSDGNKFVTASDDCTACIWDFATGTLIKRLEGHEYPVNSAIFSPDGKQVLTASSDDTARLWNYENGDSYVILKGHEGEILRAEFSENGSQIVTASADATARIWYSKGFDEPKSYQDFHSKKINDVVFSPDGRFVLSSSDDKTAKIWNVNTGCLLDPLEGHGYAVNKSAFSFDGQIIITVSADSTAQLFDINNIEKRLLSIKHNGGVKYAMFSPDSEKVVTISEDNTAKISDVKTGEEIYLFGGHGSFINSAMFSSDGRYVVTASGDCTAAVWGYQNQDEILYLEGHERWLSCASFSNDDKMILTASGDGTSRIWLAETGEELLMFDCTEGFTPFDNVSVISALFSHDNSYVFTISKSFSENDKQFWSARIWDIITGNMVSALDNMEGILQCAECTSDGSMVVLIMGDKSLRVYDFANNSEIACMHFDAGLNALAVKNDIIAVGDNLGRLHLCKLAI